MATYIRQLTDNAGNIILPATRAEGVYFHDNLIHSYKYLGRPHKGGGSLSYLIKYNDKYTFKTIAAFARFVGISPTKCNRIFHMII